VGGEGKFIPHNSSLAPSFLDLDEAQSTAAPTPKAMLKAKKAKSPYGDEFLPS
jgi:hypothetical protein